MKIAWFAIGFLTSTATNIIGFIRRTKKLQTELERRGISRDDKFWQQWLGF